MGMRRHLIFFLSLSLLCSCSSRSLDHFREEGEGIVRSLIYELQQISTQEELFASTNRFQRYFDRLVSLMIDAEELFLEYPEQRENLSLDKELNEQLRHELNRIYKMRGGKAFMEKCQEKALHRLDAYAKNRFYAKFSE